MSHDNERGHRRRIAEALILASPEPIGAARLAELIPGCKVAGARDAPAEQSVILPALQDLGGAGGQTGCRYRNWR